MPSTDIIRFALVVFGSDRTIQDFYVSTQSGKSQRNRNEDIARQILESLESQGIKIGDSDFDTEYATMLIAQQLDREQRLSMIDQVRQRGAFDLLRAIDAGERQDWIYKYGDEEKFQDDIRFLRAEGLITFAYQDYDTIALTQFGREVVALAGGARSAATGIGATAGPFFGYNCPDDAEAIVPDGSRHDVTIGLEYRQFDAATAGTYSIQLSSTEPGVDPYLTLLDGDCDFVDYNDDSGGTFDSSLVLRLEPGTYYVELDSIGARGSATLRVSRSGN